jgi:hypothetical protein
MRRSAGRGKTRSSRSVRRPAARRQSRGRHEDARRTAQERLTRESYGWSSRSAARAERAAAPPCAHGEAECIGRAEVEPLHIVEGDEQRLRLGEQLGRASRRDADPARIERLLRLLQQERDLQGTPPRRRERGEHFVQDALEEIPKPASAGAATSRGCDRRRAVVRPVRPMRRAAGKERLAQRGDQLRRETCRPYFSMVSTRLRASALA